MYPVNVYSFTQHFKHTALVGLPGEPIQWLWKPRRSTNSQSSNATLANQKHIRLQSLSLKQVVGSYWPSEDTCTNPIAGSHICRAQFIKELQVGIFRHQQVSVIISWWFPHRWEFYKKGIGQNVTTQVYRALLYMWAKYNSQSSTYLPRGMQLATSFQTVVGPT